jgi:large subunit ribosomal protein L13
MKEARMRTYSPKASEITRAWHVIDAEGMVLGRVCTEAARILRGKHKPIFAPHIDTGDHVIIVNASKVVLTSGKADRTNVYRHSGYPGGLKTETYAQLLDRKPEDAIRRSVKGMLPKGPLGRQMARKLKVYAGPEHPHAAQQPVVLELSRAKAR